MSRDPFASLLNAVADWISRHVNPDPSHVRVKARLQNMAIKVTATIVHGPNAAETELSYAFGTDPATVVRVPAAQTELVLTENAPAGATLTVVPVAINALGLRDPHPPTRTFEIPSAPGSSDVSVRIEVV